MRLKTLLCIAGILPLFAGCDGFYESRMLISREAGDSATVAKAVREYAAGNGLPCPARSGTLAYCHEPPVTVFVAEEEGGIVVCYLARGAAFESGKFAGRIDGLKAKLEGAVGPGKVKVSGRGESECLIPKA